MVHSPDGHNRQIWVNKHQDLGIPSEFPRCMAGNQAQLRNLGHFPMLSQGQWQRVGCEKEQPGLEQCFNTECCIANGGLSCIAIMQGPGVFVYKSGVFLAALYVTTLSLCKTHRLLTFCFRILHFCEIIPWPRLSSSFTTQRCQGEMEVGKAVKHRKDIAISRPI